MVATKVGTRDRQNIRARAQMDVDRSDGGDVSSNARCRDGGGGHVTPRPVAGVGETGTLRVRKQHRDG